MKRVFASLLTLALFVGAFPHRFVHAQEDVLPGSSITYSRQDKDLNQLVRQHERIRLNPAQVMKQVRLSGRLSLATSGQSFELDLQPHDMRSKRYRSEETGEDGIRREIKSDPVRTYKGQMIGREDAQARFTIDENSIEGVIITPEERYYIEPLRRYSAEAEATDFVFYKKSDVIEDATETCGVTMDEVIGEAMQGMAPQLADVSAAEATTITLREAEIATEADYQYVVALGGTTAANKEILSIMNQVDGVYESELGITFKVVYQHAWAARGTGYPYTSTVVGSEVLQQFTDHWNTSFSTVKRDIAHLWTGKDIVNDNNSTSLIGIAWVGVVCSVPGNSYGVSQRLTSVAQKYVLTAHEIGHNFGARHSETQTGCDNTVMNGIIGTALTFCPYSRNQITSFANINSGCLAATVPTCSYTISPASSRFAPNGGSGTVSLTTNSTCRWTARSNASWIQITTGTSGTGSKTVSYTVAANTGTTVRNGTITIAGKNYTVTQDMYSIKSIVLNPSSVVGGQTLVGTITLNAPAPSTGRIINLSDNLPATTIPLSLTIPSGITSKTFTITTKAVSTSQTGSVTAKLGLYNKTASLIVRPPTISSFTLDPASVIGGNTVTATLKLNAPAPSTGAVINLSDTLLAASVPASVTVPAGATGKTFAISTNVVTATQSGIVQAVWAGIAVPQSLEVRPVGTVQSARVLSVAVNPNPITGGSSATGTVTLDRTAPVATLINLSDNLTSTTIPASLTVPVGASSMTFPISTKVVSADQSGSLIARANGFTKSTLFTVKALTTASCSVISFKPTTISIGWSALRAAAAGDLNNDGHQDLVLLDTSFFQVWVLLGDGTGSFRTPVKYRIIGSSPSDVAVGDFNGDGKLDVSVTIYSEHFVSVLLGDGSGRLGAPVTYPAGNNPTFIVAHDFNRDGKQDLVVTNEDQSNGNQKDYVSVLLANGQGGFAAPIAYPLGGISPRGMSVGDFNGDSKPDLAVVNGTHNLSILLGNGSGAFGTPSSILISQPGSVTAAEVTGDNKMDLIVTSGTTSGNVHILAGNGAGGFALRAKYTVGIAPTQVVTADFDGDDKVDLAASNGSFSSVAIMLGDGVGGFSPHSNYAVGAPPLRKIVRDFNGDGKPDLVGPNDTFKISVLLNTCQ